MTEEQDKIASVILGLGSIVAIIAAMGWLAKI
ncbi:uncharacterized protein METZ01_LOCUS408385 [marine metagenome]|jgi:hypothetical protein|uniref:Uncharacterized protein n=1 Tax=marine metagenome TaxID=408172 RepID=A0A382WBL0_9ZZZZ